MAGRRRWRCRDDATGRSRCRDIKLVVTNQLQYDHRWSRWSRLCAAVGIWSTMKSTARGTKGGTGGPGVHASVSSGFAEFGIPLVFWLFFCRRPIEYNFPFLLSRPLSRKNRAVWGIPRPSTCRIVITYTSSPRAIRYTFLGRFRRQLGTMHRAIKRNVRCSMTRYDTVYGSADGITIKI